MEMSMGREILVLKNVTLEDSGWYTCTAGNKLGKTSRTAWVTIGLFIPLVKKNIKYNILFLLFIYFLK